MKKGVQHDGPRKPSSVAAGNNADWLEALRHLFKSHEDQKATMVSFLNLTNDDHDDIVQRRPTVDSRSSVDSKDLGWMDYLGSPSTEQAAGSEIWEHLESIVDDDIDDNSHDEGRLSMNSSRCMLPQCFETLPVLYCQLSLIAEVATAQKAGMCLCMNLTDVCWIWSCHEIAATNVSSYSDLTRWSLS